MPAYFALDKTKLGSDAMTAAGPSGFCATVQRSLDCHYVPKRLLPDCGTGAMKGHMSNGKICLNRG